MQIESFSSLKIAASYKNQFTVFTFIFIAASIISAALRIFYGTELTDEALYIADAYLIGEGSVPFVDNWLQAPGYTFFYFWIVELYKMAVGSLRGIFLFMRICYLVFRIGVIALTCRVLQKQIDYRITAVWLFSVLQIATFNIYSFSYNELSIWFAFLSMALLFCASYDTNKADIYSLFSALSMSAAVISYPTMIFTAVILGVLYLVYLKKTNRKAKPAAIYFITALITAAVFTAYLIIAGGGFDNLVLGLNTMINSAYFKLREDRISIIGNIEYLSSVYEQILPCLATLIIIILVFFIISKLRRNEIINGNKQFYSSYVSVILIAAILYTIYVIIINRKYVYEKPELVGYFYMLLPFIFSLLIKDNKTMARKLIYFIIMPEIIGLIVVSVSNQTGIRGRIYPIYPSVASAVVFAYMAVINADRNLPRDKRHNISEKLLFIIFAAFSSVFLLFNITVSYEYVYRDSSVDKLSYTVESGIYKGIKTAPERGEALELLERKIKENTSSDENILFMDNTPFAYLMTDAHPLTPSSWDLMQYTYGFNDDTIMLTFFNMKNKLPDKIIYTNIGRDEVLSCDVPDYQFTEFLNENYTLTYEDKGDMLYPVKIFTKNGA